jgi:hypothetical protein
MRIQTLSLQQRAYIDEYIKCGSQIDAFVKTYGKTKVNRNTRIDASRVFRRKLVHEYYEQQMEKMSEKIVDERSIIIKESLVDEKYIIENLIAIINENEGKPCAVKALELLGRHLGLFWEAPAKGLPKRFSTEDNAKAVKQVTEMVQDGMVTQSAASNLMSLIDNKSKIEEREETNSEILEKLNNLEKMAREKELNE